MRKKIEFVYFDIGGVLLDLSGLFDALVSKSSEPKDKVLEVFGRYDMDLCKGVLSPKEMESIYRDELGMEIDNLEMLVASSLSPRHVMKKFVEMLPSEIRVGLLSNTWGNITEYHIEQGMIPERDYEALVLSNKVKSAKPEEKIYRVAQEKAGVRPEKILFVDDMEVNVQTAISLGWQGLVFDTGDEDGMIEELSERLLS